MGRGVTISAVTVAERMTADQYLAIDQETRGWELIAGRIVVEQAGIEHQQIATRLLIALSGWIAEGEARGEAVMPLDVKLDHENVFAPDILWYAPGRVPERASPRPYPVPDLAIEVRSPSTWRYDLGTKKSKYEAHGLRELWLVDTGSQSVLVFRRSKPGRGFDVALEPGLTESLTSPLLPGFALALDELFPE